MGTGDFYTLPGPAVIAPGGRLVVEADSADGVNDNDGFEFGINCSTDTIRLANGTPALIDDEALPGIDLDLDTWGRHPGTGAWQQTFPTKGAANQPSPSGIDLAAPLFDPSEVAQVALELPPASVAALSDPNTWEDYQDGSFTITLDGEPPVGPLPVGVRLKGGIGSFRDLSAKAAFKIRFPHAVPGQRLMGLKTLTLNNMVQDPSMVHELLAYRLFRSLGIAAPRTGYAKVAVTTEDGTQDYGLYLNVETMDDVSLSQWYDSTEHLYEGEYGADLRPGGATIGCPAPVSDLCAFDIDEGNGSDTGDLQALIDAASGGSPADFSDRVAGVADLEQMTVMWAIEKYIGHGDGYAGGADGIFWPNNYFLHSGAGGLFTMLPWGTDASFSLHLGFDDRGDGVLFDLCLDDPSCAALHRSAVKRVRDAADGLGLEALALDAAALHLPHQNSPREESDPDEIATAVTATLAFLASRPIEANAWLNEPAALSGGSVLAETAKRSCPKGKPLKRGRCVKKLKKRKSRRP